jgi:hypothetical protein
MDASVDVPPPVDNGFDLTDRARFNVVWLLEHLLGERRLTGTTARLRAEAHARVEERLARRGPGSVRAVERRQDLGPEEFRAEYFRRSRPVVLSGLARSWRAVREWTFESLASRCGGEPVCITENGDPDFVPLSEAVARWRTEPSAFARFGGLLHERPELLEDLNLAALAAYRPALAWQTSLQFFVAAAGCVTPLHADGTCNFHVQIRGEKVWRIVEPRFNPAMRPVALGAPHFKSLLPVFDIGLSGAASVPHIDVLEALLEPGDVLFNPSFFWHEVRYRQPSISVGVRWVSATSFLRGSPMMAFLMLIARNPTPVEALLNARHARPRGFYR